MLFLFNVISLLEILLILDQFIALNNQCTVIDPGPIMKKFIIRVLHGVVISSDLSPWLIMIFDVPIFISIVQSTSLLRHMLLYLIKIWAKIVISLLFGHHLIFRQPSRSLRYQVPRNSYHFLIRNYSVIKHLLFILKWANHRPILVRSLTLEQIFK